MPSKTGPLSLGVFTASPVRLEHVKDIGVVTIDSPPVNVLSPNVIQGLSLGIEQFEAARDLRTLVICWAGRTFVAGGDLRTFDEPDFDTGPYNRTLARIEAMERPAVAALHGAALGGGLELALACHCRVALNGTQLGFAGGAGYGRDLRGTGETSRNPPQIKGWQ